MPNRILKETICTSETIDVLGLEAEAFFYRLMVQCDDFGRMDARPSVLRARCFPLRLDRTTDAQVTAWMDELCQSGLLWVYESDGRPYLQITKWDEHQHKRAKFSKYPEPETSADTCAQLPAIENNSPREARSENTRSENTRSEKGASAPSPEPKPKAPVAQKAAKPLAVLAYQDAAGSLPAKTLWDSMDEAIGTNPDDLKFWGTVVRAWIAKGWNPRNLSGMFDFFKRRELPPAGGNGHGKQPATPVSSVRTYTDANGQSRVVLSPEQERIKAQMKAAKNAVNS